MQRSDITVSTQDGGIPVERFAPSKRGPLLVIVPSIFGASPDVVEFAAEFAAAGAVVYVMDSFWREAPGPLRIGPDIEQAKRRMVRIDPEDAYADLLAVIDAGLGDDQCNGQTILLGICFGGQFVMRATQNRPISGLAAWHGAAMAPMLSPSALANTEVSLDFGANDALIPVTEVNAIRTALAGQRATVRLHDGAGHGFTHRGTPKCVEAATTAAVDGVLGLIRGATR